MESLFVLLFFFWAMMPILFENEEFGKVAFVLTTVALWILVIFIPSFFMASAWLIVSMLIGIIAGVVCLHNDGVQGWLWIAMTVISAIEFFIFVK